MHSARITIPIRWRDLDTLGHLNQAVYHEFLEEGRGSLFSPLGNKAFPFVLARVEIDYLSEVRKDHVSVDVVSRVDKLGRTSVTIAHEVVLPDGTVAASGIAVLVAWDKEARESRPLSDDERAALS